MSILFSPLTIRDIRLKNRLVVSPMCQYSSVDGFASDWHLVHLGSRAVGGAGLIFTEATAISAEGRISPNDLGLWQDDHIPGLKRITEFVRQQGAVAGIQLAHAGRKASHQRPWEGGASIGPTSELGWQTVAPSAMPFLESGPKPLALTIAGIQTVLDDFMAATQRALKAGFQVLEIHAAHGYLIHQFLSPLSNHRVDQYGGSFDNRIRLLLEVIACVQTVWLADLPLFVRLSATDWAEGGWSLDDSVALAAILKAKGIDVVDCSSGGNLPNVKIPVSPGYQVTFAARIKQQTGIMTATVGLITSAHQAEAILETGQADLILLAREFLRNPYFPLQAASVLSDQVSWPVQYERARNL
ncbi:oxidoreductase [Spirosoma sp. HMF4905]|uniref:Oxidoreductase n=1 Tax=Spirosoma arboris TaxID=2682092 RepID=A0A7K1SH85_9BACT|nr:NADH:flavin oxidoreductase/NADH oxidase [Spirosoma arboris]MVM33167.1 oxidoreductase [Spirosoma arboris]